MRALFIIHCQDPVYGASRSIGNLIRNLDADVDIIFPFKVKRDGITKAQIRKFYGPRVGRVWFLPRPARLSVCIGEPGLVTRVKCCVKDLLYLLVLPCYHRIYRRGNYDLIHLNSATLYPMLKRRWPMFLHVRESLREKRGFWDRRFEKRLAEARGLIFINQETKDRCPPHAAPDLVLPNPFDQRGVAGVDAREARRRFGLRDGVTVYAVIGNVIPEKGVDFVMDAFQAARLDSAVLLVVGVDPLHRSYERKLKRRAEGDPRIRFLGELEDDMDAVYRVTDYVVRGDAVPGAGRTVFESLYSGGGAILMGTREENLAPLELPAGLEDNVHFYPPRDAEGLKEALERTQNRRFEERACLTNIPAYVERFCAFVSAHARE